MGNVVFSFCSSVEFNAEYYMLNTIGKMAHTEFAEKTMDIAFQNCDKITSQGECLHLAGNAFQISLTIFVSGGRVWMQRRQDIGSPKGKRDYRLDFRLIAGE